MVSHAIDRGHRSKIKIDAYSINVCIVVCWTRTKNIIFHSTGGSDVLCNILVQIWIATQGINVCKMALCVTKSNVVE